MHFTTTLAAVLATVSMVAAKTEKVVFKSNGATKNIYVPDGINGKGGECLNWSNQIFSNTQPLTSVQIPAGICVILHDGTNCHGNPSNTMTGKTYYWSKGNTYFYDHTRSVKLYRTHNGKC